MQVGLFSDSIEMIALTITKMKAVEHHYSDFNVTGYHRAPENGPKRDQDSCDIAIAVYSEDVQVTFHPPVQRTMQIVQAALGESNICVRYLSSGLGDVLLMMYHRLSLGGQSSTIDVAISS